MSYDGFDVDLCCYMHYHGCRSLEMVQCQGKRKSPKEIVVSLVMNDKKY